MRSSILVFLAIVMVFIVSCQSQAKEREVKKPIPKNPYIERLVSEVESFIIDSSLKYTCPGLAVCIVKDTSVILLKGYGYRNAQTKDSVDENTIFRIGSVSKSFASFLTATAIDDSLLAWDDYVYDYCPEFQLKSKINSQQLKVEHILSHTSSVPYHAYTNLIEAKVPLDTMLKELRLVDSIAPVGKVFSYQNVAYSLIENILKKATHKDYETLLAENIFNPLKMTRSSASYESIMADSNIALPHYYTAKGWTAGLISKSYYNSKPAGGINTTAADMASFLKALLGYHPEVISNNNLFEMCTPYVNTPTKYKYITYWKELQELYYAMGFRVFLYGGHKIIYHGGYVNGYKAELAFDPVEKTGICVLSNSPNRLAGKLTPSYFDYYYEQADSILAWQAYQDSLLLQ